MDIYSQITYVIKTFILPCLIVCGFLSNMISFFVMKQIKTSTGTAKYMTYLALVDSGVLIVGGLGLLTLNCSIPFDSIPMLSLIECKLIPFMFYSFADYSVIIIVLMTAERFYGVWRPLSAKKFSKLKTIRFSLLFGWLICLLINFHFISAHSLAVYDIIEYEPDADNLSQAKAKDYVCEYVVWKDFYEIYWVFIDSFIYSFVPSFIILTLNFLIIKMLKKANKTNRNLNEMAQISFRKRKKLEIILSKSNKDMSCRTCTFSLNNQKTNRYSSKNVIVSRIFNETI